jgi:transcriptional/translational regulatory protein YebC/TACO1
MRPGAWIFKELAFARGCMASDSTGVRIRGQALPAGKAGAPLTLEGYGPGGTALLIECTTADPARTRAEIRGLLQQHGARLGAPGAVAYLFKRVGVLSYPGGGVDRERLAQLAYAAGAEDVAAGSGGQVLVLTDPPDLEQVRAHVAARGVSEAGAAVLWRAHQAIRLEGTAAREMLQLLEELGGRDDVGSVYSNAQIPDPIVAEL